MPVQNSIAGVDLASHRALYKIALIKANSKSGIIGARGAMAYEFHDLCDLWISETKVILKINYLEGIEVKTIWTFSSLESKDGMSYRFNLHHSQNGDTVEVLVGKAGRGSISGKVTAELSSPLTTKIKLPKGTMFPTHHLAEMLEAGKKKKLIFSKIVFDGASLKNPYQINALITQSQIKKSKTNLTQHVRMAFFPLKAKGGKPEFELAVNYRSDGVAERIKQDYGNFSLDLKPNNIEILEKSDC